MPKASAANHTAHACADAILASSGQLYAAGGGFADDIDKTGGKGAARFASAAIAAFAENNEFSQQ